MIMNFTRYCEIFFFSKHHHIVLAILQKITFTSMIKIMFNQANSSLISMMKKYNYIVINSNFILAGKYLWYEDHDHWKVIQLNSFIIILDETRVWT